MANGLLAAHFHARLIGSSTGGKRQPTLNAGNRAWLEVSSILSPGFTLLCHGGYGCFDVVFLRSLRPLALQPAFCHDLTVMRCNSNAIRWAWQRNRNGRKREIITWPFPSASPGGTCCRPYHSLECLMGQTHSTARLQWSNPGNSIKVPASRSSSASS